MMDLLCPICNKEGKLFVREGRDFFVHEGKSEPFNVYFCEVCKAGYTTPFLSDLKLSQYYPEDYEAYKPKKGFVAYIQRLKYKGDLKIIKKLINGEGKKLFEIGAGRGESLAEAQKAGFFIGGAEPGEAGRSFAQENFGISLRNEWASDIVYEKKYDVVVLRHVIEHLNYPVPVIENIFKNGLSTGGLLFLKLPRLDSWETKLFGKFSDTFDFPRHRVHFTRQGLYNILDGLGFTDIQIMSEVVPLGLIRSIQYYSCYGPSGLRRFLAKLFSCLPGSLKILFAQLVGFVMQPFGSGRMIVTARKDR